MVALRRLIRYCLGHSGPQLERFAALKQRLLPYRRKFLLLSALILAGYAMLHPGRFIDFWLTRDQQATLAFNQGNYDQAATGFQNQRWRAYSHYAAGDFQAAADIFGIFDDSESMFARANALAHAGKYYRAQDAYEALLAMEPEHARAYENLIVVQQIIFQMEHLAHLQISAEKGMSATGDLESPSEDATQQPTKREKPEQTTDEDTTQAGETLENDIWLEQVQKNPVVFLRKKFSMEHADEH